MKEDKVMFKGNQKQVESAQKGTKSTFIAKEIEVTGNFNGEGSVQVEGTLHGDITVTSVVIGENGIINGTITATNVIVNGKLNGSIFCDTLEVMPNGNVSNDVKVKKLLISGSVKGSIEAKEEITLDSTGNVNASIMKSKTILINGMFKGKVTASEILEIGTTGSVEGEITVKNIKTHEGGKLLGSIHSYVEEKEAELFTEISEEA
jgi:cytoskeletal protein CcmA (bactofilin family)